MYKKLFCFVINSRAHYNNIIKLFLLVATPHCITIIWAACYGILFMCITENVGDITSLLCFLFYRVRVRRRQIRDNRE